MNNAEINQGRKNYKRLLKEKERHLEIQKQINVLENNPYVRKYLSLINEEKEIYSSLLYSAYDDIVKDTKDNDNIFIYMGFIESDNKKNYFYYNLESGHISKSSVDTYENFEKENRVLFPVLDEYRRINSFGYINICLAIREEYLNDLLIYDKDDCVKELIKKYQNT